MDDAKDTSKSAKSDEYTESLAGADVNDESSASSWEADPRPISGWWAFEKDSDAPPSPAPAPDPELAGLPASQPVSEAALRDHDARTVDNVRGELSTIHNHRTPTWSPAYAFVEVKLGPPPHTGPLRTARQAWWPRPGGTPPGNFRVLCFRDDHGVARRVPRGELSRAFFRCVKPAERAHQLRLALERYFEEHPWDDGALRVLKRLRPLDNRCYARASNLAQEMMRLADDEQWALGRKASRMPQLYDPYSEAWLPRKWTLSLGVSAGAVRLAWAINHDVFHRDEMELERVANDACAVYLRVLARMRVTDWIKNLDKNWEETNLTSSSNRLKWDRTSIVAFGGGHVRSRSSIATS